MSGDPDLLILATLGAGLLGLGGAVLRSALRSEDGHARAGGSSEGKGNTLSREDVQVLREELEFCNSTKETQRIEMVEQRQRTERQVQGAQAEIQRLAAELETERERSGAAAEEIKSARAKLEALERLMEAVRARSRALAEELKALKGG